MTPEASALLLCRPTAPPTSAMSHGGGEARTWRLPQGPLASFRQAPCIYSPRLDLGPRSPSPTVDRPPNLPPQLPATPQTFQSNP